MCHKLVAVKEIVDTKNCGKPIAMKRNIREALIYSLNGYNTDHQLKLHGALGNASTNAR